MSTHTYTLHNVIIYTSKLGNTVRISQKSEKRCNVCYVCERKKGEEEREKGREEERVEEREKKRIYRQTADKQKEVVNLKCS